MQSYTEAVFLLFQATLLCNGSSMGSRRILQLGQENYMLQLSVSIATSMSVATMEEEIVGVSVR